MNAILGVGIRNNAGPGSAAFARDANRVSASATKAAASTNALSASMKTAGASAAGAASSMAAMFGIFGGLAVLATATSTLAQFGETMAIAGKVSRATGDTLERMTEQAKMLGATTRFTADEAGQGLLFLGRAGFEAEDAMSALPATLDLAAAGVLSLGEAADMASNIVKQFQLSARETVRVVDALVIVSNRSNTSVQQLGEALAYAGPVANAVGLSVEQAAAAIGVLGDAGIQASLAGTALRGVFAALLGPTSKAEAAIKRLIGEEQKLDLQSEGLVATFDKLAAGGITAADAVEIFGRRQAAAALVMADSTSRMRELELATVLAAGEAAEMSEVMGNTLRGSLLATKSAFEGLMIAAGDGGLTGVLQNVFDTLTGTLRIFAGLSHEVDKNRTSSILLSAAVVALTARFAALKSLQLARFFVTTTKAIIAETVAANGLRAALAPLGGVFGIVAGAAGIAAVAIFEMSRRAEESEARLISAADALKEFERTAQAANTTFDTSDRISIITDDLETLVDGYRNASIGMKEFGFQMKQRAVSAGSGQVAFIDTDEFTEKAKEVRALMRDSEELLSKTLNDLGRDVTLRSAEVAKLFADAKAAAQVAATTADKGDDLRALNMQAEALAEALKLGTAISKVEEEFQRIIDSGDLTAGQVSRLKTAFDSLEESFDSSLPAEFEAGVSDLADTLNKAKDEAGEVVRSFADLKQEQTDIRSQITPDDLLSAGVDQMLKDLQQSNEERKVQQTLDKAAKQMGMDLMDISEAIQNALKERIKLRLEEIDAAEKLKNATEGIGKTEADLANQIKVLELRADGREVEAEQLAALHRITQQYGLDSEKLDQDQLKRLKDLIARLHELKDAGKLDDEDKVERIIDGAVDRFSAQIAVTANQAASTSAALALLAEGASPEEAVRASEEVTRSLERQATAEQAIADVRARLAAIDPNATLSTEDETAIRARVMAYFDEKDALADLSQQFEDNKKAASDRADALSEMQEMAKNLTRENERLSMSNGQLGVDLEKLTASEQLNALVKEASIGATEEQIAQIAALREKIQGLVDANAKFKETTEAFEIFEAISNRVEQAMTDMFMSIIDGTEEAGAAFKKLALAISEMILQQIIAQQIVAPLVGAIGGAINPAAGAGAGAATTSALGNVFEGGELQRFQYGGIVNRPVEFPMANNRRGLMGEAGPEAILPLQRDSGGRLGVAAVGAAGEQKVVNVNMNVSTPDADSFKRSRSQIMNRIRSGARGV